jgi:hypothetical protein
MRLIGNSVGVAAVIVAAQLCVAQALQIMRWRVDSDSAWRSLLAWVVFIYATGVLAGSTAGRRSMGKATAPTIARVVAALFSAVGATAAIVLVWLPARDAKPPVAVYPGLVVITAGGTGIVAGLVVALVAMSTPAVAGNIRATAAWVWLVAIGSAAAGLATHRTFHPPRLAVVDAPSVVRTTWWWAGPNLMVAIAALLGFGVAAVARWGGAARRGVALSGLAGPAVVAAAYLIAGAGTDAGLQASYRAALLALGAGLVGSVLVALPAGDRVALPLADQVPTSKVAAQPPAADRPIVGEVLDRDRSPVGPAVMGQPKPSPDDDYNAWLKGLGERQRT